MQSYRYGNMGISLAHPELGIRYISIGAEEKLANRLGSLASRGFRFLDPHSFTYT
jgi:hypothetical protein